MGQHFESEHVETISGPGRLRLSDREIEVEYVIRVYQDVAVTSSFQSHPQRTPILKTAAGGLKGLSNGDAAIEYLGGTSLKLSLQDGRAAQIRIIDEEGEFEVLGSIE